MSDTTVVSDVVEAGKIFRYPDSLVLRHAAQIADFSISSFYSVIERGDKRGGGGLER